MDPIKYKARNLYRRVPACECDTWSSWHLQIWEGPPRGPGPVLHASFHSVWRASTGALSSQDAAAEQQHLWRANMEELNRRLRHEVCIQMVRDKHGSSAATALAAMLAASRQHETKVFKRCRTPATSFWSSTLHFSMYSHVAWKQSLTQ